MVVCIVIVGKSVPQEQLKNKNKKKKKKKEGRL